jgi:hypothetical protein
MTPGETTKLTCNNAEVRQETCPASALVELVRVLARAAAGELFRAEQNSARPYPVGTPEIPE